MIVGTFEVNKLVRDDFGRSHGILAIDKPVGLSSHDVVYEVRRALQTKQVGHAGALDPFASGLVFIIVGRATKLSDDLMTMDKAYAADVLFGVGTDSQDTEGEIIGHTNGSNVSADQINAVLNQLKGGYTQYVPVYSSVKVNGQKLRVLARKYASFELFWRDQHKFVRFVDENKQTEIALPTHDVSFTSLNLDQLQQIKLGELDQQNEYNQEFLTKLASLYPASSAAEYKLAKISTDCPKGTYIRQLAEDIGERLDPSLPAMLTALRRTRIGSVTIDQALTLSQLQSI
jgi:tRNA pseudouridine55 synthase